MSKIVAVDFDGTLCENKYPEIGQPNYKKINLVKYFKKQGWETILYTCREGEKLNEALEWLKQFDLKFDYVNENSKEGLKTYPDCSKIYADVHIDDHNFNYNKLIPQLEPKITILKNNIDWDIIYKACQITRGKKDTSFFDLDENKQKEFKLKLIKSEHSPIRIGEIVVLFENVKSFVVFEFDRHKVGCEFFEKSNRCDFSQILEDEDINRNTPIDFIAIFNMQAILNISKQRLCNKAHPEARYLWSKVKNEISKIEPELASLMLPKCKFYNVCNEFKSCKDK